MLNFGLSFADLYDVSGLHKLDRAFTNYLEISSPHLHESLMAARRSDYSTKQPSPLIIDLAVQLESFMAQLFKIDQYIDILQQTHQAYHQLSEFKRRIIQKRILPKFQHHDWQGYNAAYFKHELALSDLELIRAWYNGQAHQNQNCLDQLENYIAWRCLNIADQSLPPASPLFAMPQPLDFDRLFDYDQDQQTLDQPATNLKIRDGFDLTDPGPEAFYAYDHAHYCLKCHKTNRDSCAQGLREKTGEIYINPLDNALHGCPLEQKISEMNVAKHQGYCLAALAIITLDNPMVAMTGYRICNDCQKACIFQKQTPVDVPSIETQILMEILALPWGFEIYSLLTRWNPLNFDQPLPSAPTDYNVLVVGMGPAGFTLAHYLLRNGHNVLGVDALKIEPLPNIWWGRNNDSLVTFDPIKDIDTITEPLGERAAYGFGGVAEYGITSRWNKNFLTIIRLILMRSAQFRLSGNTRFGGTINLKTAQQMGFDHVALCLGSGKPNIPVMPNILAKGVRIASDFLMNLQSNGAARLNSLARLQVRLPIVIIGGGLTAVDSATEALAYYKVQVESFLIKYEQQCALQGQQVVEAEWSVEEREVALEFITHARLLRHIKTKVKTDCNDDDTKALTTLQAWGGVQIIYRKTLQQAPAYRTNAVEIEQALRQGVRFIENTALSSIETDCHGAVYAIKVDQAGVPTTIMVRTLLLATGVGPNTYYGLEHPDQLDWTRLALQDNDSLSTAERPFIVNAVSLGYASMFGDVDPQFSGSVVKAMASAKQGYLKIDHYLKQKSPLHHQSSNLINAVGDNLQAHVISNTTLSDHLHKLIVKAPLAAQNYQVGQFYKLQNYEKDSLTAAIVAPAMKGIALTPIEVDKVNGYLTFVIADAGRSSRFAHHLKIGDPVVVMGPTGAAFTVAAYKNVLIMADHYYGLLLLPIIEALQQAHCQIHIYVPDNQDSSLLQSFIKHNKNIKFHQQIFSSSNNLLDLDIDQIIINGTLKQIQNWQLILTNDYAGKLKDNRQIIVSINAPMQCMMKEICAQCVQQHIDPETGAINHFYACAQQWQPFKTIDLKVLQGRHEQNNMMTKF